MSTDGTKPDHLDPQALLLLEADDEARIRYIQRDRFILHGEAEHVLSTLNDLALRPRCIRPRCVALLADAGGGKSTLIEEFLRGRAEDYGSSVKRSTAHFVAEPFPTVEVLQVALMKELCLPTRSTRWQQRAEADGLIRDAIKDLGIRVIVMDELGHIANLPPPVRKGALDWVKWISTACGVSWVACGIPDCESMLRKDGQLQTRFQIVSLHPWREGPALAAFLTQFERSLPLAHPSGIASRAMQKALLDETYLMQQIRGVTHGIKLVLEAAAIRAIRLREERITKALLTAWRDWHV